MVQVGALVPDCCVNSAGESNCKYRPTHKAGIHSLSSRGEADQLRYMC